MRRMVGFALVFAATLCLPRSGLAQGEQVRKVAGGGISAAGWQGTPDHGSGP